MWTFKEIMLYITMTVFALTLIYSAPIVFPNDRTDWDPNVKISTHLLNNIKEHK
jgi:hypothetical protein